MLPATQLPAAGPVPSSSALHREKPNTRSDSNELGYKIITYWPFAPVLLPQTLPVFAPSATSVPESRVPAKLEALVEPTSPLGSSHSGRLRHRTGARHGLAPAFVELNVVKIANVHSGVAGLAPAHGTEAAARPRSGG